MMQTRSAVIAELPLVDQQVLQVTLYYDEGGANAWDYSRPVTRGYHLSAKPVKKEGHFTTFSLFKGLRMLLQETNRFNAKTFESLVVGAKDSEAFRSLVRSTCEKEGLSLAEVDASPQA